MINSKDLETYLFNNRYDENIINRFISQYQNSLYNNALEQQRDLQRISKYVIKASDMIINKTLNKKYNLPELSRSCKLLNFTCFAANGAGLYFSHYGNPLITPEVRERLSKIFDKDFVINIGKYHIRTFDFLIDDGNTYLILQDSIVDGITSSKLDSLLTNLNTVHILSMRRSEAGYVYMNKVDLIANTAIPDSIFGKNFSNLDINKVNYWDFYITGDATEFNLLVKSSAIHKDNSFIISEKLRNYIFNNAGTCKCYVVRTKMRTNTYEEFEPLNPNIYVTPIDFSSDKWINKHAYTFTPNGYMGLTVALGSRQWTGLYQVINATVGEKYRLSAYVKSDKYNKIRAMCISDGNASNTGRGAPIYVDNLVKSANWQLAVYEFTVTQSGTLRPSIEPIEAVQFSICGIKLEKLVGLDVGNVFKDPLNYDSSAWQNRSSFTIATETYNGLTVLTHSKKWRGLTQNVNVKVGEKYIISAYIKASDINQIYFDPNDSVIGNGEGVYSGPSNVGATTEWKLVLREITVTKSGILRPTFQNMIDGQQYWICGLKLEKIGETGEPVKKFIQLNQDYIPYAKENILVWKYDKTNDIKEELLTNIELTQNYPNLITVNSSINNIAIDCMWNMDAKNTFDNNFEVFMDYCGDEYGNLYLNKYLSNNVLNYTPIPNIVYSYEDYKQSAYFGDLRRYRLSKLTQLLADNPMRYKRLEDFINIKERRHITYTLTYEISPFIFDDRNIMDNSMHVTSKDDIKYFTEPQSYFMIDEANNNARPASIYIDGLRANDTYVYASNNTLYIYFNRSLITKESVITVDVGLDPVINYTKGEVELFGKGTKAQFPNPSEFGKVIPDELVYHFKDTNFIVNNSDIKYLIRVTKERIQHTSDFAETLYYYKGDYADFHASDDAVLSTLDTNRIYVEDERSLIGFDSNTFNKAVSAKDVFIYSNNELIMNNKLIVSKACYRKAFSPTIPDDLTLRLTNFRGNHDADRFRVYIGGKLVNKNQYTITFTEMYAGVVEVVIKNTNIDKDQTFFIEYLPHREIIRTVDLSRVDTYDGTFVYLTNLPCNINIRNAKIYINGVRLTNDRIKNTEAINTFKIEGVTSSDTMLIYVPYQFTDIYSFSKNTEKDVTVCEIKQNREFRQFMLEQKVDEQTIN